MERPFYRPQQERQQDQQPTTQHFTPGHVQAICGHSLHCCTHSVCSKRCGSCPSNHLELLLLDLVKKLPLIFPVVRGITSSAECCTSLSIRSSPHASFSSKIPLSSATASAADPSIKSSHRSPAFDRYRYRGISEAVRYLVRIHSLDVKHVQQCENDTARHQHGVWVRPAFHSNPDDLIPCL